MKSEIGIIGIIVSDEDVVCSVNQVLHNHADAFVGRIGIPRKSNNLNVISVIIESPEDEIRTVVSELEEIEHVAAKYMINA